MADDPVLVVDRRVLDVMVEVLERLRVEDDDGDRLPDLAVLPVQKLGHEIGVTVGRLGERRRLAPAEALAVAPEDPELPGVLLWLLETDSGRTSSTGGPARRPRLADMGGPA